MRLVPARLLLLTLMCCMHMSASQTSEAEITAEDAYIFLYPVVENYKTMWFQAVNKGGPKYVRPFNKFYHARKLADANTTTIVTPNDDTLYSLAWLDLRTEPMVLSLPRNVDRYFCMQMVDGYTFNFCILGTRKNSSGDFLIAGPSWKGEIPPGFDPHTVLTSESEYVFLLGRTEVYGKTDLPNVWAMQQKYHLAPLSVFLGGPQTPPLPGPAFLPFSNNPDDLKNATYFFNHANFILSYIAIHPTEVSKFETFKKIGVEPGKAFPPADMDNATLQAIQEGLLKGDALIDAAIGTLGGIAAPLPNGWSVHVDPPPFGNRSVMQGRYLARACGARVGLYGLDPAEAFYPRSTVDGVGEAYDASKYNYVMEFSANGASLPKVHAFWSLSMYNKGNFFVPNVDNKYSIGDHTKDLVYGDGGKSLTIYIQNTEPSQDKPNWLPAPNGKFNLVLRLYWPDPTMLSPPYIPPAVTKVDSH